jgi:hypothetical protein
MRFGEKTNDFSVTTLLAHVRHGVGLCGVVPGALSVSTQPGVLRGEEEQQG